MIIDTTILKYLNFYLTTHSLRSFETRRSRRNLNFAHRETAMGKIFIYRHVSHRAYILSEPASPGSDKSIPSLCPQCLFGEQHYPFAAAFRVAQFAAAGFPDHQL